MPEITNSGFSRSYKSYKRKYMKKTGTKKGQIKMILRYFSRPIYISLGKLVSLYPQPGQTEEIIYRQKSIAKYLSRYLR